MKIKTETVVEVRPSKLITPEKNDSWSDVTLRATVSEKTDIKADGSYYCSKSGRWLLIVKIIGTLESRRKAGTMVWHKKPKKL